MQQGTVFFVIGIVGPIGCDKDGVVSAIEEEASKYSLKTHRIDVDGFLKTFGEEITATRKSERLREKIQAINNIRQITDQPQIFASYAIQEIAEVTCRSDFRDTVFVVDQIKRRKEAEALKRTYQGLYLQIGIHSSEAARLSRLKANSREPESKCLELFEIDEDEDHEFGQEVIKTFHLSDYFLDENAASHDVGRFFRLIFNHPFETPTPDEHFMYLASATASRSGDLSRQVGACIVSERNDLLATGANDVPQFGGGLYWPGTSDKRDYIAGYEANTQKRFKLILDVFRALDPTCKGKADQEVYESARAKLPSSEIFDLTEFARSVHAEMDAILTCARNGVSTVRSKLFTTTYPCHNCAKHIVSAGIEEVIFIEPYPKSLAAELHADAIFVVEKADIDVRDRVILRPFYGVGPRRYLDFFSMNMTMGVAKKRKDDKSGNKTLFRREKAEFRFSDATSSYKDHEKRHKEELKNSKNRYEEKRNETIARESECSRPRKRA